MDTIGKIFSQLGEYRKQTLLAPLFTLASVALEVAIPFVMGILIDRGISAGDMGQVVLWGIVMLVCAAVALVVGALSGVFGSEAAVGLATNLRDAEFKKVQTFSFSNIDKFSTAGLVTRMTTDVTNVQNAFQMGLIIATRAPITLIVSMAMCVFLSPSMSLVFVVAMVLLGAALFGIMFHTLPMFGKVFERYDDLNASVQENVNAIRVVKAFVRERFENKKFANAAGELHDLFVAAESMLAWNNPVMMCAIYGCIIALSWFGTHAIMNGNLTTGELTSLFGYIMNILMSLMMLTMVFVMLTISAASANRIVEVLEEEPDIVSPENAIMEVPNGSIDFENASFSYRTGTGESTLDSLSLHIESGETVGVLGPTGSGKSTFVALISRLYDVSAGKVEVGGNDVRAYDTEVLRDAVAVVLQQNTLFSGTILDNLRWGNEHATREECIAACQAACADEFIDRMPDGYDTQIEQGGTNVSGGQRQRLCIARALLKRPRVLILDDSTSAVDTATDASIQRAFAEQIPSTTKLIISQRVSSFGACDRILVLDAGRVAAFGTEAELLETCDIYRDVYEAQNKAGSEADFDPLEGGAVDPLSQRYDPAFASELAAAGVAVAGAAAADAAVADAAAQDAAVSDYRSQERGE
ncbi:MAG: ABC transporter ATP-binding protein [Atopobiaceae bacterium]|nr:ABC transporter ATP-binding protein [Atopobiaceae bacterium]